MYTITHKEWILNIREEPEARQATPPDDGRAELEKDTKSLIESSAREQYVQHMQRKLEIQRDQKFKRTLNIFSKYHQLRRDNKKMRKNPHLNFDSRPTQSLSDMDVSSYHRRSPSFKRTNS